MNVLVTGANGFMGSNLVRMLIEAGDKVTALVLKGTNEVFIKDLDCTIVYGDVTKKETLIEPLKNIDIVYHLAAIAHSGWSNKIYKVNYGGTKSIYQEAIKAGVKRFVYMSSLVVHGLKHHNGVDESTPLAKVKWYRRPYTKSKIMCEQFLEENKQKHKMEIVILRPGFVPFGPHDILGARTILTMIEAGKPIPNINHGKAKVCYIYIDNLCDALLLAGKEPKAAGQIYLLLDNDPPYITMKEMIASYCHEFNAKSSNTSIPYGVVVPIAALLDLFYRIFLRKKLPVLSMYTIKIAKYNLYFQSNKAYEELGFKPNVNFKEGIKRTVDWYKKVYKNM